MFENPFHIVNEAHAQHFIGFIQHHHGKVVEVEAFSFQMIHHPARRADDDVSSTGKCAKLYDHALTTIDRQYMKAGHVVSVFLEGFGDLNRQFAGRGEDQNLRCFFGQIQFGQHGQGKSSRLSCSCLGFTQKVASCQDVRDAGGLNGGGRFIPDIAQCLQQGGG